LEICGICWENTTTCSVYFFHLQYHCHYTHTSHEKIFKKLCQHCRHVIGPPGQISIKFIATLDFIAVSSNLQQTLVYELVCDTREKKEKKLCHNAENMFSIIVRADNH